MQVAHEILNQLGGNKFVAMTGANTFVGRPDGLTFKVGKNAKKVTHVRVTLTPADEYTVEFLSVRGLNVKTLATRENVYNDNIQAVFTTETGLYTRM